MKNYNFRLIYKKHTNISWIIPSIIWSLIIGFVVMLISGYFLGYNVYSVMGASSEPDIHYGSIVIDLKVPFDELKVGDYVTWTRTGNSFVTHRIIEIRDKDYIVTSQTDYFHDEGEVPNPDSPITYDNIKGKVIATIPELGNIFVSFKSMIKNSNGINILGLMTLTLVFTTYYLFKRVLYVETYTLKEY